MLVTQTPKGFALVMFAPAVALNNLKDKWPRRLGQSRGGIETGMSVQLPLNQHSSPDLVSLTRFVTTKQNSVVVPLVMNLFVGTAQVAVDLVPPFNSAVAGPPFSP